MADTIPKCHLANEQGKPCQFFRWAPGSSKSPSASPPTLATPTLPSIPVAATYTSAPAPITTTSSGPNPSKCPIQGCGQTRLADDCTHRFCRKHCLDAGGCSSKTHRLLSLFPPTLLLQPRCPLLRDMAHKLSHHPRQLLPTTSPLNPSTHGPTHASHHTSFPFTSSRWHVSKHSSSPRANLMLNALLAPSKLYKRLLYMLGGLIMLNPKAVNYKKGLHGPS